MTRGNAATVKVGTLIVADSGELVPAETCRVEFSRDRRIQGAIEFQVNGQTILGRDDTDTIDALWSLLLNYLEGYVGGRRGVLNFPERRFVLSLEKKGRGNVLVKFSDRDDGRAALVGEKDVLCALVSGAIEFFSVTIASSPRDEWSYRRDLNSAVRLRQEWSDEGRSG